MKDPVASSARATAMVAASACSFGAISIFTITALRAGTTLQFMLIGRYGIAAVALLMIVGGVRAMRIGRSKAGPLMVVGGIGQALITYLGLSALTYVPAATASFLFYTYPAWVTLLAAFRRTEPLTPRRLAALALALAGVAVMVGSPWSGKIDPTGVLLALSASIVYAFYIPAMARVQAGVAPAVASAWVCIAAAAIYAGVGAITGTIVLPTDPVAGWIAIVGVALVSTVAGFILFLRGLAIIGPVKTAIVSTVEPFFTSLAAAVVLGQRLSPLTFAGGVLIAAAVTLLQTRQP